MQKRHAIHDLLFIVLLSSTVLSFPAKALTSPVRLVQEATTVAKAKTPGTNSFNIIQQNLNVLRNQEVTRVVLPVNGEDVEFHLKHIQQHESGILTWRGTSLTGSSTVLLTTGEDHFYARINHVDNVIVFTPESAGGVHISKLKDPSLKVPFGNDAVLDDAHPQKEQQSKQATQKQRNHNDDGRMIDIVVLYTSGYAAKHIGTAEAHIQHLIDVGNTAFANSRINTSLRLAHSAQVNYSDYIDLDQALNDVTDNNGVFSNVETMRDRYGADQVTLLRDYVTGYECGMAWIMTPSSSGRKAYAVVDDGSVGGSYCSALTLVHEIGHNLGCEHDHANAVGEGLYPYSYGLQLPPYHTVMSYDDGCNNCKSISYFSNPDIYYTWLYQYDEEYTKKPTGVEGYADNSRTINNTRSIMSGYRQSKYNSPPVVLDRAYLTMSSQSYRSRTMCLDVDQEKNLIMAGSYSDNTVFDPAIEDNILSGSGGAIGDLKRSWFIQKLNKYGSLSWVKSFEFGNSLRNEILKIKTDSSGNIYVLGVLDLRTYEQVDLDPGPGRYHVTELDLGDGRYQPVLNFILKLDAQGDFIWANEFYGGMDSGDLEVDNTGNIYWFTRTGYHDYDPGPNLFNIPDQTGVVLCKYDTDGIFMWAKLVENHQGLEFDGQNYVISNMGDFILSKNGNFYLSGHFHGTVDFDPGPGIFNITGFNPDTNPMIKNSKTMYISKFDNNANFLWTTSVEARNGYYQGLSTTLDHFENILIGTAIYNYNQIPVREYGHYNIDDVDIHLYKIDTNGNFIWEKSLGSGKPDHFQDIVVDSNNDIVFSGLMCLVSHENDLDECVIDMDPGPGVFNIYGRNKRSLGKLDNDGKFIWAGILPSEYPANFYLSSAQLDIDSDDGVYGLYNDYSGFSSIFRDSPLDYDPNPTTYYFPFNNDRPYTSGVIRLVPSSGSTPGMFYMNSPWNIFLSPIILSRPEIN